MYYLLLSLVNFDIPKPLYKTFGISKLLARLHFKWMFVCQSALLKWELFSDRVKIVNYDLQLLMLVIWIFPPSLSLYFYKNNFYFRKGLPHVFVCRIWRWPDLRSYCELRTAQNSNCSHPYVHHSKSNHQKVMCINPYHYVKATSSATVPPPVLVPRHFDPMPTSSSSSTLDENYLQPGGTTNWVVEPTNNILNNQSQPSQENDLAMPSSHMSSGLVSHSDLSFSTVSILHSLYIS